MNTEVCTMTRAEEDLMLQQIWEEVRYVRKKLDNHVESNDRDFGGMKEDVTKIKEDLRGHKTKLGVVFSAFGLLFTSFTAWAVHYINNLG